MLLRQHGQHHRAARCVTKNSTISVLESWREGKHEDSERLTALLWPPADVVPSTRALLHDRRGGRSIFVEVQCGTCL